MRNNKKIWYMITAVLVIVIILLVSNIVKTNKLLNEIARGHGDVNAESYTFTESAKELDNPGRGFYYTQGFVLSDEETDFRGNIATRYATDDETKLSMVQINLRNYKDGTISAMGLKNLDKIFTELEKVDKQYIVRFLYDWSGENDKHEPASIDIILEHMGQVGPIVSKHKDIVFVMQGLFIGNFGEMNGTPYVDMDSIQALSSTLAESTDESIFLSVRMPMFWRMATGTAEVEEVGRDDNILASRLGLYNDGLLGSWSDYGTYGNHTREVDGDFTYWNREEELAFQETLCKLAPVGGEVMNDNEYNDFENAVKDMKTMHVSYLNRDYDKNVLEKWGRTTVEEEGCFNGMDGLTYIDRHLGYRFFIHNVMLDYTYKTDILTVNVDMQNVGFAPVYSEKEVRVIFLDEETQETHSYLVEQDIRDLTGGNASEEVLTLQANISLTGEEAKTYTVFFDVTDPASGERIIMANEEEPEQYGYRIGTVEIQPIKGVVEK